MPCDFKGLLPGYTFPLRVGRRDGRHQNEPRRPRKAYNQVRHYGDGDCREQYEPDRQGCYWPQVCPEVAW